MSTGKLCRMAYLQKAVNIFRDCTIPTLSNATVSNVSTDGNNMTIATKWSQRNYTLSKSEEFSIIYNYNKCETKLQKITSPSESSGVLIESFSPSFKQRAVIKKHANETSKKDEYVFELWSDTKRIKTINLTTLDKHGQVHSDSLFGSLCWSQDETKVIYVAEKKKVKTKGFFEVSGNLDNSDEEKFLQGEKFDYEENWGEQLTDVTNTVLCLLCLTDDDLKVVDGISEELCPLQPIFGPGNTLVFSAFDKTPFRLGAIYCENRPCGIYQMNLDGDNGIPMELTNNSKTTANYHAHMNKGQSKIVFFQRELSGSGDPHRSVASLVVYDIMDGSTKSFGNQLKYNGKVIPLFVLGKNLKYNIWLLDDVHIAIPNTHEGRNYLCIVDTNLGLIKSMTECTSFFGLYQNIFLASSEKLNSEASSLMLIHCDASSEPVICKEHQLIDNDVESESLIDQHGITSFYIMPKVLKDNTNQIPLLVSPHGGPHSTFTYDYNRTARFFCKLGYAVLLVNYRGSSGFTIDSLMSLPGNVGTQDVLDVQNIVNQFIDSREKIIDKKNIFVAGGSHGGFLAAHLIGQYPNFYKAACLRNPVIEISSMSTTSDIPDWTYFEAGVKYTQNVIPSVDSTSAMLTKSPITFVKDIKAPVLLCIGGKDARVPPSQGTHYFKVLKANKKVVKMLYYPNDSHPLSTVETDGDHNINICRWFYEHGTHSR